MNKNSMYVDSPDLAKSRRGQLNPERYENPFYLNQIRTLVTAYAGFNRDFGKDKSIRKRDFSPIFSFDRFGRSETTLDDGRRVLIGGSHEDSYDPDFFIYNDVCVINDDGEFEYFIYPLVDFPATDQHTATLVDDKIWIIGNLGYKHQRDENFAQVLTLNVKDWRVSKIETTGDDPGWISRHSAVRRDCEIIISGGRCGVKQEQNLCDFGLNTKTMVWRQMPEDWSSD